MKFCRQCGKQLEAGWKACAHCGARVAEDPTPPRRRLPGWALPVAGSVVALIIIGSLVASSGGKKPASAIAPRATVAEGTDVPPMMTPKSTPPPTVAPIRSASPQQVYAAPAQRSALVAPRTAAPVPVQTPHVVAATPVPAASTCGAPANPWGYNFCGRGGTITSPPSNFCSYFPCIGTDSANTSFWNGTGYVVECGDGDFSKSGGHSGACSSHSGEKQELYSG